MLFQLLKGVWNGCPSVRHSLCLAKRGVRSIPDDLRKIGDGPRDSTRKVFVDKEGSAFVDP